MSERLAIDVFQVRQTTESSFDRQRDRVPRRLNRRHTTSPALSLLGDIDFAPWQCLAELVDNSFDDFLARPSGVAPVVTVQLPGRNNTPRNGQVWVKDNRSGMDIERLNSALRTGWTGNSRQGQFGLFGMGFDIATARLGHVTKIRTTRAGDTEWVTVELDLRLLQRGEGYRVPVAACARSPCAPRGCSRALTSPRSAK